MGFGASSTGGARHTLFCWHLLVEKTESFCECSRDNIPGENLSKYAHCGDWAAPTLTSSRTVAPSLLHGFLELL